MKQHGSHPLAGPGFAELRSKQNEKYNNLVERVSYYRVWQNGNKAINKHLWGALTPNQKLPCFVLYLKIVNIFLKNDMYILTKIVQRTQKWH